MDFFLINIFLVAAIIFLLLALSCVWPPDSPWAPWWKTDKKTARLLCRLAKITKKDVIYDLGCGDATALIIAAKEFDAKGVGIEIDPLRFLIARLSIWFYGLSDSIILKRKNFFKEDIKSASVVFVYLVPKALQRLKPKFLKELKPGTRICSFRYTMDLPLIKEDKKNKVYIYKIS